MSDPRGPIREITKIEDTFSEVKLHLNCGHISLVNPIYSYKAEKTSHCIHCLDEGKTQ